MPETTNASDRASPVALAYDEVSNELLTWLRAKLHNERETAFRLTESRHEALLLEYRRMFDEKVASADHHRATLAVAWQSGQAEQAKFLAEPDEKVAHATQKNSEGLAPDSSAMVTATGTAARSQFTSRPRTQDEIDEILETIGPSSHPLAPEPRPGSWERFENAIKHEIFEVMSLSLIIANTILMAFQQQYVGYDLGYDVGFRDYRLPADEFWPWAEPCFKFLEPVFAILFTLEILVKLVAFRKHFFFSLWSYMDIVVAAVMLISWLRPELNAGHQRLSFARLARFGKMARIAGKTQTAHFMSESLKLIVSAIKGSFVILFWSLSIMVLLQILAGMTLGSLVEPFLRNEDQPDDIRYRVFKYYGTFWRSMVTMFEVSLANWAPACRVLFDEVDEAFSYFFLFYRCVVGFAVLSVIQAVFIQQTMKSIQLDDNTILEHQRQQKEKSFKKLKSVFEKLDTDQDGNLTWDEFQPLLYDDRMKLTIDSLDLSAEDLKKMFYLMDKGDGKISWEELHEGLPHIKGSARSVDMVSCINTVDRLEKRMSEVLYGKSIVLDSFNI